MPSGGYWLLVSPALRSSSLDVILHHTTIVKGKPQLGQPVLTCGIGASQSTIQRTGAYLVSTNGTPPPMH